MLPMFFSMLQGLGGASKAAGAAGGAAQAGGGADRFGQLIGTKGNSFIQPSNKNIGMQYANMGLNAPEVPNMLAMLNGMQNQTRAGGPRNLPVYDILSMLRGGQ